MASKSAKELLIPSQTLAKITETTPLDQGRFVNLKKLKYTNPLGKDLIWEMATRPTKPIGSDVDAVIIIPVLHYPSGEKKIVLVRQFRPPTNGVCVEFPAGLVDPNDSIESCAIRELKEECGLVGEVKRIGGTSFSDPGLCDATCSIVWCDVDMSLEANLDPTPQWMDNEVIEVVYVPIKDLEKNVATWRGEGYKIDSKVESVIVGLNLSL